MGSRGEPPGFAGWTARHLGHYFGLAPSPFHLWLRDALATLHRRRATRLNVRAPRGAAKSTWSTLAYPLWAALHAVERHIVITSDSSDQAEEFLQKVRLELEDNDSILSEYPHAAGKLAVSKVNRLVLRNGVKVDALGTGKKIRGRSNRQHRPSLIIVDDPQGPEHVVSEVKRTRSWDWLTRDAINAGSPQTNVIVLGTPLHPDGIVTRLQRTAGWGTKAWRSLPTWPDRMDLWSEWETLLNDWDNPDREAAARGFYEANRKEMERGAVVLWPERWPLYELMVLRATIGHAAFEAEMNDNPIDPASCEWPPEYLDWPGLMFEKWPERLEIRVVSIDPSKGKDAKHGDYSAIVSYGRSPNDGIEYVEADLARRSVDRICSDAARICAAFKPDLLVLETNGFQELLKVPLLAALKEQKVEVLVKGLDNTTNKNVRIRRLTVPLQRRKLRFRARSPGTQLLLQQMRQFPNADHDDGPDALEQGRRAAIEHLNGSHVNGGGKR